MTEASDVIRDALQEINVQAAEQPLSGDETLTAIRYMNRMVNSWPVDISWTDITATSDTLASPSYADRTIVLNLAVEMAPQFDVPVAPTLRANASSAYLNMLTQAQSLATTEYSDNLPKGSGNIYPGYWFSPYYTESD